MILTSEEHIKLAKAYEKKAKDKKVPPEQQAEASRMAKLHRHLSQRAALRNGVTNTSSTRVT